MSQKSVVFEYFTEHPNREIPTQEVVDWVVPEWEKRTGKTLRDPDRAIRTLFSEGKLQKIRDGIYKYDPQYVVANGLDSGFSKDDQQRILEKYNHRCAVCGGSEQTGHELHIDHIKPRSRGGLSHFENGQVLCSKHNFQKRNYDQVEFGRIFFEKLKQRAFELNDESMLTFAEEVLDIYNRHDVDIHVEL